MALAAGAPQVLIKAANPKLRVASLDPMEADTPANTKLLKMTEKEVELNPVISYSALAHPVYFLRKKRDLNLANLATVHGVATVAAETPASTGLMAPFITAPRMVYMI